MNHPVWQSCDNCHFFVETVDAPTRESAGACVRKPRPVAPILRTYWCGKYTPQPYTPQSDGEVKS